MSREFNNEYRKARAESELFIIKNKYSEGLNMESVFDWNADCICGWCR